MDGTRVDTGTGWITKPDAYEGNGCVNGDICTFGCNLSRKGDSDAYRNVASDVWEGSVPRMQKRHSSDDVDNQQTGEVPSEPNDLWDEQRELELLWTCCTECWSHNAAGRPTMAEVNCNLGAKVR